MADMPKDKGKGKGSGLLLALSGSPSAMSGSKEAETDPALGGVGDPADPNTVPPELESGAEEIVEAMQVGDASGLARALQSFVTMCV